MSAFWWRIQPVSATPLILRDKEVGHGDVADLVHGRAEGRVVGAWKNGQSAAAISRALERKNKTGVERIVVLHGGIVPVPRRRGLAALRLEKREEISRGIAVGRSIRQIAQGLGRAPSTVSREIRRNGGSQAYRANRGAKRPRPSQQGRQHRQLRQLVVFALKGFVEKPFSVLIGRFCVAVIARADQNSDIAVDIAFVAHLAKCNVLHPSCDSSCFADGADERSILGCHWAPQFTPRGRQSAGCFLGEV